MKALIGDENIADIPLLILANKIDKCGSAGEDEIRHAFNLHALTSGKVLLPYQHFSRASEDTLLF